jgi:hypothetical protein
MRFQRRGGRKRIVAPDGSEIARTTKPQPDGTLVKALARAWRWQRMLDGSVCTSISEIGDVENISKGYVSRILRLALLAPDIAEAILAGRTDQALIWRAWSGRCWRAGRNNAACCLWAWRRVCLSCSGADAADPLCTANEQLPDCRGGLPTAAFVS